MLEVTCFHCGQVVQISPDAERCSVCGMNLRKLIGRELASSYFYTRAADFAGAGNVLGALQEVQRGLSYVNSSELNLLGAILCKRLSRWEDMRHYVAAIPADDALRGEGEWLLRSNQARQRPSAPAARGKAQTGGKARDKAPVALPIVPDSDALPVVFDQVAPSARHSQTTQPMRGLGVLVALTLVAVLAGGGWITWQSGWLDWLALPNLQVAEQVAPQPQAPAVRPDVMATILPAGLSVPAAGGAPLDTSAVGGATEAAPTAPAGALPSLGLPTPTISPNLVQSAPAAQAVASTSGDQIVAAANLNGLNWRAWLGQRERGDLAALPITVRMEGKTLVLEGTVEYAEQRAALEFEARQIPGVEDVSLANVKLRPPQTYTVLEGDSLWAISVRIYGNANYVEALYAANRDRMASAGDLSVGMVLNVPAIE